MLNKITPPPMPMLLEDLGMIFTSEKSTRKYRYGIYMCHCGVTFTARSTSINNGDTKSCGCYSKQCSKQRNTKHGFRSHPIYPVWSQIIGRTTNEKHKRFSDYGGRGITVCDRWLDVANFIEDMYPSYQEGLSIDRRNNNGNYEPSNCRWVTREVQARNTRKIILKNKSGYRGVCFNKKNNVFGASICINNKQKYLGSFLTALEGAKAYDTYVIENNLEHTINGVLFSNLI